MNNTTPVRRTRKLSFDEKEIRRKQHIANCEFEQFRRLLTEVYPKGILSVVSDTWDLFSVLTKILPALKSEIMARDGKLVIRPDSGDPVQIICGNPVGISEADRKGVIELLWDVFGGTVNGKGYKVLDPHVGAIYGDSITLHRAQEICERLKAKGFASQCIYGIGSFSYQYVTRDTFGTAIKATWVQIDGQGMDIFKKPITDDGLKNSATGLLRVEKVDGKFKLFEKVTPEQEQGGELRTVYEDGKLIVDDSLAEIRKRLAEA